MRRVAEHGRTMWIHHGCRCRVCHAALLEYSRTRCAVQAVAAGRQPQPRLPAGPVRRHVAELRTAGWSVQRIADAAGVSYSTIDRIAHHRLERVALSTRRAVMALRP